MNYQAYIIEQVKRFFITVGDVSYFTGRFFKEVVSRPVEFQEFVKQCYMVGYKSLPLVATTSLIMGMVLTLQTRPTLVDFGAVSLMPSMVGISIVREIGPVITALICAGKVGSGIGAELGSMRVTEQIDAMEVSGTNPFKYLVVTRILATTITLPILVVLGDTVGLTGSFIVENIKGSVSFTLFFNLVFDYLSYGDLLPSIIKSFFFGFAIGVIGCYKGYNAQRGTAGVGLAANSAVVITSMLLFFIDFLAVLVADIFYEL
ncbi:MlaE family ABC transporter permease [Plebeiibacterium marinum]|uniref:ABC transporter permease n=1 Tax=Plebeiibacterium marinum TaxID=2992111 RepID=A0AAE3SJX5_9BACT|nr:ABC transporter permease [Plebeiobacterium marinum]MCW3804850.1 ABC transporter permease [Plebeiobacterium marinum]